MAKGHAFVLPNLSWLTQSGDRVKIGREPPVPYRGKLFLPVIYEMKFNEGLFRPRPSSQVLNQMTA
jgi:hypothetical protein